MGKLISLEKDDVLMAEPGECMVDGGLPDEADYNANDVFLVSQQLMDQEFLMAAKSGDLDSVKECIKNGVDINVTSPGGLNALHFASRENHYDVAEYVIDNGIDANAITKRLNSALHIACLGGHTSIAALLLKHGCPLNVQAMDDITPLYMAAQENHIDTVKLLLKHEADPHIPAKGGYEPVDIAIQQGYVALQEGQPGYGKVVQMLLQHKGGLRALHVAARRDDPKALQLLLAEKLDINERIPNGYTPLHVAAKNGSLNAANYLIDHGADLNSAAKGGVVPLHVASRHGQLNVLGALIEAGAKLGIATDDGLTALHCAARNGHHNCVELLVVRGAPLTAKTKHGLTALHMAAQANHAASANHIITHGAHIDDVTLDGVTPLHVTSHYGHVETCQLLVEKGADIDQKARNGYTALHIAAKKNREAVVQLLLKYKSTVNIKNNNGQIPLHVAAFFGHVNIVLLLLQSGASLEATTIREETVLHIACRTNQIQIVRLLLRNGANVNAKSKDEDTPLHNACRQGSASLVNLLLDNRGDPDVTNKEGCCALHLAARDGQDKIIDALLDHNADVTLLSKRGFTPLHEAVKKGHVQIIEMLLERKADVNAIGKNGLTPLHFACHYDRPDVAVKLLNNGADPHVTAKNGFSPLHISAEKNQVHIVSLLLERGVEVDLLTGSGVSPLHLAAKEGNVEVVDMLLEHGASPCTQSLSGLTPLHVAVHYNQIEVVQKLLKYGASMEIQTKSGFTPLHLACMHGHFDVAEQLLSDGSDVEAKTKNGNTPLHIASYKGHQDIVELLLKYNAPPNALNKDGYSALYIAEVTAQTAVVNILTKITKVVVKVKSSGKEFENSVQSRSDKVRSGFLAPESLEESFLVDTLDEAEEEAHIQKKVIKEDFEESFAGLEDSRSDHGQSLPSIINESLGESIIESDIEITQEHLTMADNSEDFLRQLEESDSGITSDITSGETHQNGYNDDIGALINGDVSQPVLDSTSYNLDSCTGPQKQGRFLVSFNVDARGCVMESKHTGIRVLVPRGACRMPTRITARLRKSNDVMNLPQLSINEALVSRVVQLSPVGTQFLKPVVFEIPHFAALKGKQRELVALTCTGSQSWREHGTSIFEDEQDLNSEKITSMKIITQEVPEKIVVISRPRKERFVMSPDGGTLESVSVPNVKVIFPPDTLNMSTKVVLQVQLNDDSLLHPEEQTHVSPIVCLEPPTTISKSITIIVPCDWLVNVDKTGRRNIRLLAWMTRSPRKSAIDRIEFEWKDITGNTGLSIVDETVTFETSEFTRYWVVQTNSPETLTKRINQLQQTISATPFSVRFFIYGRLKSSRHAELRVFVVTDEHAKEEFLESIQGFKELSRSSYHHLHSGQTVHINISGNLSPVGSQNLKLPFLPFQINRLKVGTEVISPEVAMSCRVTFIGSLRRDGSNNISSLCTLSVSLTPDMIATEKFTYPEDTVDDNTINLVGQQLTETWMTFAKELNMNKRDKQAVVDISTGKRDIASVRLLEYWRSKHPPSATYKALFDALKRDGLDDLAENVYNAAPNKFSREVCQLDPKDRNYSTSSEPSKSPLPGETSFAQGAMNGHSEPVFEEANSSPIEQLECKSDVSSYSPDDCMTDVSVVVDEMSAPSSSTPDCGRPSSPTPSDERHVLTDEERYLASPSSDERQLVTDNIETLLNDEEDPLLTPDDLISRSIDDLSSLSPSVSSISPDDLCTNIHDDMSSPIHESKSPRTFSPDMKSPDDVQDDVTCESNIAAIPPIIVESLSDNIKPESPEEEIDAMTVKDIIESEPSVDQYTVKLGSIADDTLETEISGECEKIVQDPVINFDSLPDECEGHVTEEISAYEQSVNDPVLNLDSLDTLDDGCDTESVENVRSGPSEYELSLLRAEQEAVEMEPESSVPSHRETTKELVCENPIMDSKLEDNACEFDVSNLDKNEIVDEPEVTADYVDDKPAGIFDQTDESDKPPHSHTIISTEETVMKTVVKTVAVVPEHDHEHNSKDSDIADSIEKLGSCCAESAVVTQETQVIATKKVVSVENGGEDVVKRMFSQEKDVMDFFNADVALSGRDDSQENGISS